MELTNCNILSLLVTLIMDSVRILTNKIGLLMSIVRIGSCSGLLSHIGSVSFWINLSEEMDGCSFLSLSVPLLCVVCDQMQF